MDAKNLAQQIFKTGICSSVDPIGGYVRVTFPDRDDIVSDALPVITKGGWARGNAMPEEGEQVACLFLGNGLSDGVCLGAIPEYEFELTADQWGVVFDDDNSVYYDRTDQSVHVKAKKIVIDAPEVVIETTTQASIKIYGNLTVYGTVKEEPPVKG